MSSSSNGSTENEKNKNIQTSLSFSHLVPASLPLSCTISLPCKFEFNGKL